MRWTVHDNGAETISFAADINSPLRYGHGQGYTLNGKWCGRLLNGTGYFG